jgi:hypothetical protein
MARRGLTGQLNMFDFFRELETNILQDGEQEMVSLMPNFDEEYEPIEKEIPEEVIHPEVSKEDKKTTKQESKKTPKKISKTVAKKEATVDKGEEESLKETEALEDEMQFELQEEREIVSIHIENSHDRPVMHRTYSTEQGIAEIAYINYGKVRVCEPGKGEIIREFASSKEAVDYYVEQMQKLEALYTVET